MNRASIRWLSGWVLLAILGPAVAFACSLSPHTPWTKRSGNGRFTLEVQGAAGKPKNMRFTQGPVPLTLRNARGKVLWKQDVSYVYPSEALISPSGRHVAIVSQGGSVLLYGPKGKQIGTWDIAASLTKAEQARIPLTSCGPMFLGGASFKGELLELSVRTGGMLPPTEPQPPGILLRLNPETRKLTRVITGNAPKLPELLERWRTTPAGSERTALLEELSIRASSASKPGAHPELRSFWVELSTTSAQQEERVAAVRGLQLIGTDDEVRGLATLPEEDLGTEVLGALDARLPREAEAYAMRLLEKPSLSEELRKAAVAYLLGRKGAVAERGLALGLRDASPQVRESAITELAKKPPTAALFEQLLPLCQDPDTRLRSRVVEFQLLLLEGRGPERKALLAALRRAEASGKLEPFPEGWIILGGLADLEGKHPRALELYEKGVKGLSSLSAETRSRGTTELLFEALLQLAIEAKTKGQEDELAQRVHDVLAVPNSQNFYVSAPKPNRYARAEDPAARKGAEERKSAMLIAKELVLKPKPAGHRH